MVEPTRRIYGRKLEIFLIDDTSQPAEIMAAYRKLNEADHILLLYLYSWRPL